MVAHDRPRTARRPASPIRRRIGSLATSSSTSRRRCASRGRGIEEEAVRPVVDEVDRATRVRGDHRQAGRVRLLHRLAERLLGAGVHEHVHGGVRGGELAAAHAAEPRDGHARERAAGGRLARAVARDEEAHAADPAEGLEPLELLLGAMRPT